MMWPWADGDPFATGGRRFPAMDNADVRLTYEVTQRLQADARTRDARITVEVQNGVAILDSTVGDIEVKQLAADTARDTPGVRDVCNALLAGADRAENPRPPRCCQPSRRTAPDMSAGKPGPPARHRALRRQQPRRRSAIGSCATARAKGSAR